MIPKYIKFLNASLVNHRYLLEEVGKIIRFLLEEF
jgi:hypothetical protein